MLLLEERRTIAGFNLSGTQAPLSDALTRFVANGAISSKHPLMIEVGVGSSSHDFDGAAMIKRQISSSYFGVNAVSFSP